MENGRGRRVEGEGRTYVGEIPGVRRGGAWRGNRERRSECNSEEINSHKI